MKVLNLYAGIGGNRKLWTDVDVTAVELDHQIAAIYQDFFPDDTVIVDDAHEYLLHHYKEFDFIWSSPPCQTHSRVRYWGFGGGKMLPVYPDMKLYEEILFLKYYCDGLWVVENVVPFYPFLVIIQGSSPCSPSSIDRHLFWSSFYIPTMTTKTKKADINRGNVKKWQNFHGLDISKYSISQRKDKVLRSCVNPELGLHILNTALNRINEKQPEQLGLFK